MRLTFMVSVSVVSTIILFLLLGMMSEINPGLLANQETSFYKDLLLNTYYIKDLPTVQALANETNATKIAETLISTNYTVTTEELVKGATNETGIFEIFGVDLGSLTRQVLDFIYFNIFNPIQKLFASLGTFVLAPIVLLQIFHPPLIITLISTFVWMAMWAVAIYSAIRSGTT